MLHLFLTIIFMNSKICYVLRLDFSHYKSFSYLNHWNVSSFYEFKYTIKRYINTFIIPSYHTISSLKQPSPTHFYSKPNGRAVMEYQNTNTEQNLRDSSCIPYSSSVVLTSAPMGIETHKITYVVCFSYISTEKETHTHAYTHTHLMASNTTIVLVWWKAEWNKSRDEREKGTPGGERVMKLNPNRV